MGLFSRLIGAARARVGGGDSSGSDRNGDRSQALTQTVSNLVSRPAISASPPAAPRRRTAAHQSSAGHDEASSAAR